MEERPAIDGSSGADASAVIAGGAEGAIGPAVSIGGAGEVRGGAARGIGTGGGVGSNEGEGAGALADSGEVCFDDGESLTSALGEVVMPAGEFRRARPIRMGTLKASKDGSSMLSAKRSLCPPADAGR